MSALLVGIGLAFVLLEAVALSVLAMLYNRQSTSIEKEKQIMAKLKDVQDAIDQLKIDFNTALTKELGEITTQIQALKAKIGQGGAASESDLDDIINRLSVFKTGTVQAIDQLSATDTADDTTPAPTPTPAPGPTA